MTTGLSHMIEARARELAGAIHVHGAIPHRFWREAIDDIVTSKPPPAACGCTFDANLNAGSVCPHCGHRDHGRSGCLA